MREFGFLVTLLTAALVLGACSGGDDGESPTILAFDVDARNVLAGTPVELSWRTEGATSVRLEDPKGGPHTGLPLTGSLQLHPLETTTFRLVARNGSQAATASQTVVVQPQAPKILIFEASQRSVASGQEVDLSWEVERADSLSLVAAGEDPIEVSLPSGSLTVRPGETTRYELRARNGTGTTTARLVVAVDGGPAGYFRVDPGTIEEGQTARLSWELFVTDEVEISARGERIATGLEARGHLDVHPTQTTTYELAAKGPGGSRTFEAVAQVGPAIERFQTTAPGPYRRDGAVEVSWLVHGADRLQLANADGHTFEVDAASRASGVASVPVGASGVLTLTAWKGEVASSRNLHLTLTAGPRVAKWEADPTVLSLHAGGEAPVTLSWALEAADRLEILAFPGGQVDVGGRSVTQGTMEVPVSRTTTFRLTGFNGEGSTSRTLVVEVVPRVELLSFEVLPSRISAGEEVEVHWSARNAAEVHLERDGAVLERFAPGVVQGSWRGVVEQDATFTLVARNRLGAEERVVRGVTVGAPANLSFASLAPYVAPGATVELEWENAGGRSLQVRDGDGAVVCATASLAEVARGSCQFPAPPSLGFAEFELEVANGAGESATATTSIHVTDGPVIESFTASPGRITEGSLVTFAWRTAEDALGRLGTLTLVDDLGQTFDLRGGHPSNDSVFHPLRDVGLRTFTLTASTPGTTPWEATATVDVVGVPTISFTATPAFVDTATSPTTTLAWETMHGAHLRLFRMVGGVPVQPPLVDTAEPARIAAGVHQLTPISLPSENFRLVVQNVLGHVSSADLTVEVDPAHVDLFTADRLQLIREEATALSWATSRADSVTLVQEVEPAAGTWLPDPAYRPNAVQVYGGGRGDAMTAISFPAGFTFPWGHDHHDEAKVSSMGFLTFDMEAVVSPWFNQPFPVPHAPHVHLAPFWDYIRSGEVGTIWMELLEDEQGRALLLTWRNFQFEFSTAASGTDLNFAVLLREDGQFEFRYGVMASAGATANDHPLRANGNSASIGYQSPDGSHHTLSFDTAVAGGLSHRTWVMPDLRLNAQGTRSFAPHVSARFHLTAKNGHSEQVRTLDLEVVAPVKILQLSATPEEPAPGAPFELSWLAEEALALQVRRDDGEILCNAAHEELQVGSCILTEPAGTYVYELHAQGPIARNTDVRSISVQVAPPLTIDTFALGEASVRKGEGTTLTWATTNADAVTLLADGQPVDLGPVTPLQGTVDVAPDSTTVYELVATAPGRERRQQVELTVRLASIDELTLSSRQIVQGQSVTLTWATDAQRAHANPAIVSEVSQTSPYSDIRLSPTTQALGDIDDRYTEQLLTFPAGFTFPHFGVEQTAVKVFSNGLASFDLTRGAGGTFRPFPTVENKGWHLAPFHVSQIEPARDKGGAYWDLQTIGGVDVLIVQWSDLQFWGQAPPASSLDFQMLLFADGAIEYRYGTLHSAVDPNLAAGSSALIGAQDVDGRVGATLSFLDPYPGGLQGRAFRIATAFPAAGSAVLSPKQSTDYVICVQSDDYTECDSVRLVVVEPGDLMITELQIAPSGGQAGQWIEVRNVAPDPIDLQGMQLSTSAGAGRTIASSVVIAPGEYAVLAASSAAFPPDYVYGLALPLPTPSGGISLGSGGSILASAVWGGAVPVTPGASLELDGLRHLRRTVSVTEPAAWCTATQVYAGTDRGSPGASGAGCLSPHYDVDFYSLRPFIDIRSTGTSLPGLHGSPNWGQIPGGLGFPMPYFGGTISDIWVVQNGAVYLGQPAVNPVVNWPLGGAVRGKPTFGMIAPYLSYLERQPGADFVHETRAAGGMQVTILQWTDYKRRITQDPGAPGTLTFQVQLWENGDIVFAYEPMEGDPFLYAGGAATTVGIEAPGNTPAIQFLHNQPLLQRGGQVLEFRWKATAP